MFNSGLPQYRCTQPCMLRWYPPPTSRHQLSSLHLHSIPVQLFFTCQTMSERKDSLHTRSDPPSESNATDDLDVLTARWTLLVARHDKVGTMLAYYTVRARAENVRAYAVLAYYACSTFVQNDADFVCQNRQFTLVKCLELRCQSR